MRRGSAERTSAAREGLQKLTEAGREEESLEREERRGLEARGGVLLASGATAVGLIATATRESNTHGFERSLLLALVVLGSVVMACALGLIARAMVRGITSKRPEETRFVYIDRIRGNNLAMVKRLGRGTWVFAGSIFVFLLSLILAAFFSKAPSSRTTPVKVTVTTRSLQGEKGEPGPAGPEGPRGPEGPPGKTYTPGS